LTPFRSTFLFCHTRWSTMDLCASVGPVLHCHPTHRDGRSEINQHLMETE
jgi:hypothetical protein